MFTWAGVLSGLIRLANFIAEWFKIEQAKRVGGKLQELRDRRVQDERVKRGLDAKRRAQREFDERMRNDTGSDTSSGD